MIPRSLGLIVVATALLALAACGADVTPATEEIVRDVQEQALGDFNDGFRAACESRSLSRIVGAFSDDACECVLRVVREQITDDELGAALIDDLPLPEAVERRTVDVCRE